MISTIFKKSVMISGLAEKWRTFLIFVQLFEKQDMGSKLRREQ